MSCPVEISHAGIVLNPLSLFTLLTSIIRHTSVRPLHFRHDDFEFSLDLRPSLAVLTQDEVERSTEQPSSFCHFHGGSPEGFKTWLSVCDPDQIEMVLHVPLATFTLDFENGTFLLVSEAKTSSCDALSKHSSKRGAKPKPFLHDQSLPDYYAEFAHLFTRRRYIELAMVGEYSLFTSYKKNVKMTRNYMKTVVHMANSLYDSLNIEIRLVHLDVFTTPQAPESAFEDEHKVLLWFKKYMKMNYKGVHYDAANLFLQHDFLYCDCPLVHGCVMHAEAGEYKQYWSNCSLAYLDMLYKSGADYCMWNKPGKMIGPLLCGNGFVDKGEDCDCGQLGCVAHDCCDMTTCKFRSNARCASGSCCDLATCSLRLSDALCRKAESSCDIPEFCDEIHSECPVDTYRANGDACSEDMNAICFDGRCASRDLQCKDIWGENTIPAAEKCYELNRHEYGCGVKTASSDMKCSAKDTMCGRLQCIPPKGITKPLLRGWAEPTVWTGDAREHKCTMMLAKYQTAYTPHHHLGMTLDGTSCGDGKYCLRSKCVYKLKLLGCTLGHFFEENHCKDGNECVKPNITEDKDLYCNDDYGLQAELNTHLWVDISSAKCIDGKFEVVSRKRLNLTAVVGFRCVRKIIGQFYDANDCETNEECAKPQNCTAMKCDHNWALQTKSTMVWSEVQSVRCDSDKFVIDEKSSEDANSSQRFRCVRLKCSSCENPCPTCPINSSFSFDPASGWNECATFTCGSNSQTLVERLSGDTDKFVDAKFECSSSANDTSIWKVNDGTLIKTKIGGISCEKCLAGYVVANGTRMSHGFQASCRKKDTTQKPPHHPIAEQNGPSAAFYITCSIVLLLIIVTIIIITLKIAGRRIIEKVRGRKIKDSTFSGSTSKTVTPSHKSPSVLSTRKE